MMVWIAIHTCTQNKQPNTLSLTAITRNQNCHYLCVDKSGTTNPDHKPTECISSGLLGN